jgi:hypothetical protein
MKTKRLGIFSSLLSLFYGLAVTAEEPPLDAWTAFQTPPAEARPFVRWWWNGNTVQAAEIRREIGVMHESGIGGFEINPIEMPPIDSKRGAGESLTWLSPEWIEMVKIAVDAAHEKGMVVDLIVGSGWPFGGEFLPEEQWAQRLYVNAVQVKGPREFSTTLADLVPLAQDKLKRIVENAPTRLQFLRLGPVNPKSTADLRDLPVKVSADGSVRFQIPAGEHQLVAGVLRRGFTTVAHGSPGAKGPVVDHYSRTAVRNFLERMSGALNPAFGGKMGNGVRAVFCDSIEISGANWTGELTTEFRKRCGYELDPWLPFVVGSAKADATLQDDISRVRYDFSRTLGELFNENFVQTFHEWAHENGVLSRYQAYGLPFLMDMANGYRIPDIPESNSWLYSNPDRHGFLIWTKYASSGGHLADRSIIASESATNTGGVFRTPLHMLKADDDSNFIMGVNHSVLHGFNYSPPEAGLPGWVRYGSYFSEQNTWWPWFDLYTERNARISAAFQPAEPAGDVAILAATGDIWSQHGLDRGAFHKAPRQAHLMWKAFHSNGVCADYVTEEVLRQAEARAGALTFGPMSYRMLVVAGAASLEPETAEALARLAEQGVRICWVDPLPNRSLGWNNAEANDRRVREAMARATKAEVNPISRAHVPGMPQMVRWAAQILDEADIVPSIRFANPHPKISQIRYEDGDRTLYFVANLSDRTLPVDAAFSEGSNGMTLWDAESGARSKLPLTASGRWQTELGPRESKLIVREPAAPEPAETAANHSYEHAFAITGSWEAHFTPVEGEPFRRENFTLEDLGQSEDPALAKFAGEITYVKRFEVPAEIPAGSLVDLGVVHDLAEVSLNGKALGVSWYGRHRFTLPEGLAQGTHRLEVKVATVLFNALKARGGKSVASSRWIPRNARPAPAGLVGPVTMSRPQTQEQDADYTVAAFYWPSLHDDPRWRPFFQGDRIGEWKSIKNAKPKYEGHWQPRIPLWGYEMEDDPEVMGKKIDAAVRHGVNCFIFDWYWFDNQPFLEGALNDGFLQADNVDQIDFYLMWANHDALSIWNLEEAHKRELIWPGAVDFDTFKVVVERVIRKYFKHPSYLKIEGKPVFAVYDLANLFKGLGGRDEAAKAIDYFENEVKKAGFPGLHLQILMRKVGDVSGVDSNRTKTGVEDLKAVGADSMTHYQFVHTAGVMEDYIEWADTAIKAWDTLDEQHEIPYFPQVSIGWDNNARFKTYVKDVRHNVNPQVFKRYLRKAKDYVDARPEEPNIIVINSWNEWVEGSYLEPDRRFGFGYLEAVYDVFGKAE